MGQWDLNLQEIAIVSGQEPSREEAYLWTLGIVVSMQTMASGDYVIERPCLPGNLGGKFREGERRAIPADIGQISTSGALFVTGVIVAAWEHDMTGRNAIGDAYRTVCRSINDFVVDRLRNQNFNQPTQADINDLSDDIQSAVVRRYITSVLMGRINPDDFVGVATYFNTTPLARPRSVDLDLRRADRPARYVITGSSLLR